MPLTKLSERRLTRLVEYMESLPRSSAKHFDMAKWFRHEGQNHHDLKSGDPVKPEHYHLCGTSACAMGFAAQMPYFRRLGLKLIWSVSTDWAGGELMLNGKYCGRASDLGDLFGIDGILANDFFGVNNDDATPKAWAKRARKLIARESRE